MHDLIIIGAGPAGLTAALYAGRFRLSTLVLEKMNLGGQLIVSPSIDNFPGFPGGISTQDLIERIRKQVDDLGVTIEMQEVVELIANSEYKLRTSVQLYESKSIIIATGAQAKKLAVAGEERLVGRGVSYCATCDGPLFKDKQVVVIGGGDRAIEEAIFLASLAKQVSIIHRRQELRASKILEEKAKANPKIKFVWDSVIEEIIGKAQVEAIKIKNISTNNTVEYACQGVFIFVGIKPNTEFLKHLLQLDASGFIVTDQAMQSSRLGLFASGDCRQKSLYQAINACAEGAVAADSAHKYLLSLK